jgi:hypothetical protein
MKMTIDEAIKHCLEVAEDNDLAAGTYDLLAENNHNLYEKLTAESNSKRCTEFAGFNRQLAEWLTELKEAKRLLKLAVEDMHLEDMCEACIIGFKNCPDNSNCFKWRYADEALALFQGRGCGQALRGLCQGDGRHGNRPSCEEVQRFRALHGRLEKPVEAAFRCRPFQDGLYELEQADESEIRAFKFVV